MKVAFIARSTLYKISGGSTVQIVETARYLQELGIDVRIYLAHEKIPYDEFDLLHFFDVVRPANILYHIKKTQKPFVITPVVLDYSEYDKQFRKGISGMIFRWFSPDTNEYIKTIFRWLAGKDSLPSKSYLWRGQRKSIQHILRKTAMVLPNSKMEHDRLLELYTVNKPHAVIPNGVNEQLFCQDNSVEKDEKLILCAARIEGLKNQSNLIKALNNTGFKLLIIGHVAPGQQSYYKHCKEIASGNITFIEGIAQEELLHYYKKAKVHVLPSWFETCGLSSMEAAAMGCNIVISNKGYSRDYFGDDAFYCDPRSETSIYQAIKKAAESPLQKDLQEKILKQYTWKQVAAKTFQAYQKLLQQNPSVLHN